MEPHKQAKYSKSRNPDEIEEVLTDEEFDEELEMKWWNLVYSPPHPQKMKMMPRKPKLLLGLQESGFVKFLYWTKWR
jgi:hypothetical protein